MLQLHMSSCSETPDPRFCINLNLSIRKVHPAQVYPLKPSAYFRQRISRRFSSSQEKMAYYQTVQGPHDYAKVVSSQSRSSFEALQRGALLKPAKVDGTTVALCLQGLLPRTH